MISFSSSLAFKITAAAPSYKHRTQKSQNEINAAEFKRGNTAFLFSFCRVNGQLQGGQSSIVSCGKTQVDDRNASDLKSECIFAQLLRDYDSRVKPGFRGE